MRLISSWNLPAAIVDEYKRKGIEEMFSWQVECLSNSKILFESANLVYCAPTSAGKTLVSEILLIKSCLERRKKALIILPFVSVVCEKMNYLKDLLGPAGLRVDGFYGGYNPPGGGFENVHVAVCTIEKANSIVNRLLEQGKLDELGVLIVDEVHLLSDGHRGYIMELLLAKILYMNSAGEAKIQLITMSATLPNLALLQAWLNAEFYRTDFRPVELHEMIKVDGKIYDAQLNLLRAVEPEEVFSLNQDVDNIGQLCLETLIEGCSVLVFCASKDGCESLCLKLAKIIHAYLKTPQAEKLQSALNNDLIGELKLQLKNSPFGLDSTMGKMLSYGCAYHHAGLTTDERELIENGFKNGGVKILVATSTLSSGVNLPARRVIIRSPMFAGKMMDPLTYKQMSGRAGRKGKDIRGESILVCTDKTRTTGEALISAQLQPLSSCLDANDYVSRNIFSRFSSKLRCILLYITLLFL